MTVTLHRALSAAPPDSRSMRMKQISIDQDVFDFLTSRTNAPGEPPAAVLRRELRVPLPQRTLEIHDDTYAFIAAKTAVVGESISDILRRELRLTGGDTPAPLPPQPPPTPPAPAPPTSPATIIFHIPSGAGSGPWNVGSDRVIAKVGDTLRLDQLTNLDSSPAPHTRPALSASLHRHLSRRNSRFRAADNVSARRRRAALRPRFRSAGNLLSRSGGGHVGTVCWCQSAPIAT